MPRKDQIVTLRLDSELLDGLDRLATTLSISKVHSAELGALMRGGRVTRSMVLRLIIIRGIEAMSAEARKGQSTGKAWDEGERGRGRPKTLEDSSSPKPNLRGTTWADLDPDLLDEEDE
jgi:predicted transcriptional regulator